MQTLFAHFPTLRPPLPPAAPRGSQADAAQTLLGPCDLKLVEQLFDQLPDVVFFAKDLQARYVALNHSLVRRSGQRSKQALLGRTAAQLFPGAMGENFLAQDRNVIKSGKPIHRYLELHVYANREPGWCLTQKLPLHDAQGEVVGVAGISRDLGLPDRNNPVYPQVAEVAEQLRRNFSEPLQLTELARGAGLSLDRLERLFQRIFEITPREMLLQARLDAARALLENEPSLSVAAIAAQCGYSDHSAFTRQFRATTSLTPSQYRGLVSQRAAA